MNKFYIYLIYKYLINKKIILLSIYNLFFQIPAKYQSKRLDFEFFLEIRNIQKQTCSQKFSNRYSQIISPVSFIYSSIFDNFAGKL